MGVGTLSALLSIFPQYFEPSTLSINICYVMNKLIFT